MSAIDPNAAQTSECQCTSILGDLDAAHHDQLLRIEGDGAAGVAAFIGMIAAQTEGGEVPGEFRHSDFATFVACHNWNDPVAMNLLAHEVEILARAATVGQRYEAEQFEEQTALAAENQRKAAILRATRRDHTRELNENLDRLEGWLREREGDDDD
jgi:hypothetical protein